LLNTQTKAKNAACVSHKFHPFEFQVSI